MCGIFGLVTKNGLVDAGQVDRLTDLVAHRGPDGRGVRITGNVGLGHRVIGVPDEKWGEAVKAIVSLRPGQKTTEEDITNFCKQHLARYKKPKSVDCIDAIPKNPYGKVLKRELREKYWAGEARKVR